MRMQAAVQESTTWRVTMAKCVPTMPVTQPSAAMKVAMATAELGDDVAGEDPTVNELERLAAEMMGKEW